MALQKRRVPVGQDCIVEDEPAVNEQIRSDRDLAHCHARFGSFANQSGDSGKSLQLGPFRTLERVCPISMANQTWF